MDLRRLRVGEWITAVAGVVLLVSLFLPWYRVGETDLSGWEGLSVIDVVLALVALAAIGLWAATALNRAGHISVAWAALLVFPAILALILTLIRVLDLAGSVDERAAGVYVALAASAAVLAGSLISQRDERLSKGGRTTDTGGAPAEARPIEQIPAPARGSQA